MTKLRLLDLFSGIGGFSLGLERSGAFQTVAFCEIEPFPRRVLAKHWPEVPCYDDVRTLTAERLSADGIAVDAICGGFPCQDISSAGKKAGLAGERSGLWFEYARIIGELRPRYVIVENVAALLGRGLGRVLGDLASLGYAAEWHCIPASAVGAPHRRDRLWIVANSDRARCDGKTERPSSEQRKTEISRGYYPERLDSNVADEAKLQRNGSEYHGRCDSEGAYALSELGDGCRDAGMADANGQSAWGASVSWSECYYWFSEPDVGRVANGVPSRVDRLRGLGNAVVPQIPELIGRAIAASMRAAQ